LPIAGGGKRRKEGKKGEREGWFEREKRKRGRAVEPFSNFCDQLRLGAKEEGGRKKGKERNRGILLRKKRGRRRKSGTCIPDLIRGTFYLPWTGERKKRKKGKERKREEKVALIRKKEERGNPRARFR